MGVLSRLSRILTANLHGLLDRAENLEAMLDQAVRDMEEGVARVRRSTAVAIADERRLGRESERHRALADRWRDRAQKAVAAGDEPLARRALGRWHEHRAAAIVFAAQYAEAVETSETARAALGELESRLADARRRERALVVQHQTAQVRIEVRRELESSGVELSGDRFRAAEERLQRETDEQIAEAELIGDAGIDAEFRDIDRQQAIERELASLRSESSKPGDEL
jgi:phage shock protein A